MLKATGFTYKKFNFPCGEMHIQVDNLLGYMNESVSIQLKFEKNEDIIELLLVHDALKRIGIRIKTLYIPYVPFSRQDRINTPGECFSLQVFANLINSLNIEKVFITDPHSDVTPALINNCVIMKQHDVFAQWLYNFSDFWLISPDAGALKKIYQLAKVCNSLGVIECSKNRNVQTGEITGVKVNAENLEGKDCYIVDDICDGGRTFIEIAKELQRLYCGKITLMVTHGFFTKGLEVFDGLIDEIYTKDGKVK